MMKSVKFAFSICPLLWIISAYRPGIALWESYACWGLAMVNLMLVILLDIAGKLEDLKR